MINGNSADVCLG